MSFDISSSFSVWKVSVLLSSQQLLWSLLAWIYTSFHWVCCLLRETLLSMDSIWSLQSSFFCFASELASKVSHHCLRRVTPLVGTFPCLCLHPFAPPCVGSPKKQWAVIQSLYTLPALICLDGQWKVIFKDLLVWNLDDRSPGHCVGKACTNHSDLSTTSKWFLLGLKK